jgi:hypothetical protein
VSENIVGLEELRTEIGATMRANNIVGRHIVSGDCIGYEYSMPNPAGGVHRIRSWVHTPPEVSGRLGRKIRKALKKVVKNKAFQALGKMALSVVPGGGTVLQAAETAAMAVKAVKKAKKALVSGDDTGLRALPAALRYEAHRLRMARLSGGRR